MELRKGRHVVYMLHAHLIFVTKYRGKVFTGQHLDKLKELMEGICKVSALESASVFLKISSSHLKSITSSLDFHYDHSRTC